MRKRRLLNERGSATVEATAAIVLLILLVLGTLEVAYLLYARNVVMSSAHEGARAAVEQGRDIDDARAIARDTVERAAGGLVRGLRVQVGTALSPEGRVVTVRVSGTLTPLAPVPLPIPLTATARAWR